MKTKILLFLAGLTAITSMAFATKVTITNNGAMFVPVTITVEPGDTIEFDIASTHNVVEVTKTTWDANGNTSDGGFSLDYGGGQLILNTPGVYYYVCTPHAVGGMKGTITVSGATAITDNTGTGAAETLDVYPNPFSDRLFIHYNLAEPSAVTVDLLDIKGQVVTNIFQRSVESGDLSVGVDMAFLKPGQYLLLYRSANENYTRQVIKVQ
jgi:plastocyanin